MPSCVSTTWRPLPLLLIRMCSVPLSGLKSAATSAGQLSVAAARQECRLYHLAEIRIRCVHEPRALGDGQIAEPRDVRLGIRLDGPPRGIARNLVRTPRHVQRGLEDHQFPVGCSSPTASFVLALFRLDLAITLLLALLGAQPRRLFCGLLHPAANVIRRELGA